ncbi:hypothetical protein RY26_06970 [Pseudomonas fluorescens]|nr:hypothetical protein RY26_06970 [Pseudomonas fluorescens]
MQIPCGSEPAREWGQLGFEGEAQDAFASRLAPTVGSGRSEEVGCMQIPCGSEPAREWEQLGFEGEAQDAFASRLAPTGIASFGLNV